MKTQYILLILFGLCYVAI